MSSARQRKALNEARRLAEKSKGEPQDHVVLQLDVYNDSDEITDVERVEEVYGPYTEAEAKAHYLDLTTNHDHVGVIYRVKKMTAR